MYFIRIALIKLKLAQEPSKLKQKEAAILILIDGKTWSDGAMGAIFFLLAAPIFGYVHTSLIFH